MPAYEFWFWTGEAGIVKNGIWDSHFDHAALKELK